MRYAGHNALGQTINDLFVEQITLSGFENIRDRQLSADRFSFEATRGGKTVFHMKIVDEAEVIHTFEPEADARAGAWLTGPTIERMRAGFGVEPAASGTSGSSASAAPGDPSIELAFWQAIAGSDDPADFEAYLAQWPDGAFAALATNRLGRLRPVPSPQQARPTARYTTPGRGSADRSSIMDAARVPIGRDLRQKVIFLVSVPRTDGEWAYLQATPLRPNGKPLNWLATPFAQEWRADAMSDVVMVLLNKRNGTWRTVDYVIGPTDVHWYGWLDRYNLPEALFTQ